MIPPIRPRRLLAFAALAFAGALALPSGATGRRPATAAPRVREPAVAGLFYPKDPGALSRMIDTMLDAARTEPAPGELRALICPHAGYPYSGPVAASAYRLLKGRSYETVIVLGPSHYAELRAGSITEDDVFRTPLGDVPVSARAGVLAGMRPFALDPPCRVVRPDWAAESSRAAPARETADTWEHSVEVEVPFLQKTLAGFQILPVVCGEFDEEQAARALERVLDDRTLIVVSSDLSHYNSYASARRIDQQTVDAIVHLNPAAVGDSDACGHTPIRTLLYVARHKGWQVRVLDVRNSGDTAGDKSRVVGYAAIAFYAPPADRLTAADRSYLLDLARRTLREAAATGGLPGVPTGGLAPELTRERGCFVTLTRRGELRGCIGYILPQGPLVQAVIENARNAAIKRSAVPARHRARGRRTGQSRSASSRSRSAWRSVRRRTCWSACARASTASCSRSGAARAPTCRRSGNRFPTACSFSTASRKKAEALRTPGGEPV